MGANYFSGRCWTRATFGTRSTCWSVGCESGPVVSRVGSRPRDPGLIPAPSSIFFFRRTCRFRICVGALWNNGRLGVQHRIIVRILGSVPSCPGFDLQHSWSFSEENIVDVAGVYLSSRWEESGQWLENVDRTHLVLASGKLDLQKMMEDKKNSFCLVLTQAINAWSWENQYKDRIRELS